ncbi:MAG TPA: hypothetical protein VF502_06375 [Stellaceae bacterium]
MTLGQAIAETFAKARDHGSGPADEQSYRCAARKSARSALTTDAGPPTAAQCRGKPRLARGRQDRSMRNVSRETYICALECSIEWAMSTPFCITPAHKEVRQCFTVDQSRTVPRATD